MIGSVLSTSRRAEMSEEESKAASRRALEAFNAQDFDALREGCNEDVAELLKGWIEALPFDDHRIEIEEMIAEGPVVVDDGHHHRGACA